MHGETQGNQASREGTNVLSSAASREATSVSNDGGSQLDQLSVGLTAVCVHRYRHALKIIVFWQFYLINKHLHMDNNLHSVFTL